MSIVQVFIDSRWGNALFQYAFARAYASRIGARFQTNEWIGTKIFQLSDEPLSGDLTTRDNLHWEQWDGETNIRIIGMGQHQKHLIYTLAEARRWFTFRPEIQGLLNHVPVYPCMAHLRRGDFVGAVKFIAISYASYFNAFNQFGIDEKVTKFVNEENPVAIPGIDPSGPMGFLPDFYSLMKAPILFRGNSTFSTWPGWLGDHKRVFSPDQTGVPYDPPRPIYQDVPFVEGNHMPITSWWEGHSELHLK